MQILSWFSQVIWHGWWRVVYVIFGLIGGYDTIISQFFSDNKTFKPLSSLIPKLEYWHWWIILLIFIIFAVVVGSYKLHNKIVNDIKKNQKVIHSDSASRLFSIEVDEYKFNVSQDEYQPKKKDAIVLRISLGLTAFPSQKVEAIKLKLHGNIYDSSSENMFVGKDPVFHTLGQYIYFELPSNFKKGNYTATIFVYVEGREETKEIKFTYT